MRFRLKALTALLLFVAGGAFSLPSAYGQTWSLVWAEEFDYTGLPDPARWSYDVGGNGWGNQELQFYTENDLDNARVENGALTIEARLEAEGGRNYTSARLVSRGNGEWTYGRIEARAILPAGRGTWPAIWMLPTDYIYGNGGWPDNGEIDIMEHVGFDPERVHGTVHVDRFNGLIGNQRGAGKTIAGVLDEYHVYAIEWTPRQIDFMVDDEVYFRYFNTNEGWQAWPFDNAFHVILNIAVGGTWGGQQGVDDSAFPTQMLIDYVRVYQNTAVPTATLTSPAASATLDVGASLNLAAEATAPGAALDRLEFLQGEGVLATSDATSFTTTLEGLAAGCYDVRVRAVDADGWSAESDAQPVTVGSGDCPQAPYLMRPATIPGTLEAEYYDLGGNNVAYRELGDDNTGGGIRRDESVDISTTSAGDDVGYYVSDINVREWMEYTVVVEEAGTYSMTARVASASSGGSFAIELDGTDVSGTLDVPDTATETDWTNLTVDGLTLSAGVQTLRLSVKRGGFTIDRLTFARVSGTSTEATVPERAALSTVYPNPFSDHAQVSLTLPAPTVVAIQVYNVLGQQIAQQPARHYPTGAHTLPLSEAATWPAGLYVVQVQAGQVTHTMKLLKMQP